VSQSPDKLREPIADLPNPELNPLLNPVLGRHLGQWAHVYFTTAPEKRDEALYELIEDLKAEETRNGGPEPGELSGTADGIYAIVCPRCERSNLRSQKYCGMCGALMPVRAQAAAASGSGTSVGNAMFEADCTTTEEPFREAVDLEPIEQRNRIQEDTESQSPFAATSLLFQSRAEEAVRRPVARSEQAEAELRSAPVDIDWLRNKNFPSQSDSSSGIRNYLLGIAVVLCIGILVFLLVIRPTSSKTNAGKPKPPMNWNIGQNAPTPMPTVESSNGAAASASSPNPSVPQADVPMTNDRARGSGTNARGAIAPTSPAANIQRQAHKNRTADATAPATPDADQNAIEVTVAKQYLSGSNGHPDGAAAAELLWKAVGKGNSTALLMLSDLYASGNGVPKNCDQARLLLQAALRRNVSAAASKMQEIQKTCP
jgi:hypothetical protein